MKQVQDAYIVAATRTPIGRSHKGSFRHLRPDELLAHVLRSAMAFACVMATNSSSSLCGTITSLHSR